MKSGWAEWGQRLKTVLRQRSVTQVALAARLGKSQQAVAKWVAGGDIGHESLKELSAELGVSWVWLRYGDEGVAEAMSHVGMEDRLHGLRQDALSDAINRGEWLKALGITLGIGAWGIDFKTGQSVMSDAGLVLIGETRAVNFSRFRELCLREDAIELERKTADLITGRRGSISVFVRLKKSPEVVYRVVGKSIRGEFGNPLKALGLIYQMDNELMRCRGVTSTGSCRVSSDRRLTPIVA